MLSVRDLSPSRDFLLVGDAVQAWLRLSLNPAAYGSTVNICTGVPTRINALVEMVVKGSPIPITIHVEGTEKTFSDSPVHFGDPGRLRELTGLNPQPPTDAIIKYVIAKHLADARAQADSPFATSAGDCQPPQQIPKAL
jgi:nucleoside-diphosphate-sugar epimerase